MTNTEANKIIMEIITDRLSVITDEDFVVLKSNKLKEPVVATTIFPHLSNENLGYKDLDHLQVLKVLKKLKAENQIFDCNWVSHYEKPDEITEGLPSTYWFGIVVILTKSQVASFGKPMIPKFDSNTGYLEYRGIKLKFRKSSKQYKTLELLFKTPGEIVPLETIFQYIEPKSINFSSNDKLNLYGLLRELRKKLKSVKITEDIFMDTNDGFGVKN